MGFFDEWLVPIFGVAAAAATGGAAAPALAGTEAATAAATAAGTTGAVAEGATALNAANTANAINAANTGSQAANAAGMIDSATKATNLGAMDTLGAGLGQTANEALAAQVGSAGSGIMQAVPGVTSTGSGIMQAAPEIASGVPEVATAQTAATAPELAQQGIKEIGPNMGQVNPVTANPANYGNAVPGMPESAPFGSIYQTPAVTNAGFPDILGRSVGDFAVTPPVPSALERGFDKAMTWAGKNPIPAAMLASNVANTLFKPEVQAPKKKTSNMPKYSLSPNFQGTTDNPQPYKWGYAEGGIAALANGGMGNNQMYPQGMQDHTQYATPSQMPASAEVINSDYEPKTDPYSGNPVGFAEGGEVKRMAEGGMGGKGKGGSEGRQVYWDPEVGQYYYEENPGMAGLFSNSPMGMASMGGKGGGGKGGRTYIGGLDNGKGFNNKVTPNVYNSGYGETAAAPVSNVPMMQAIQNSQQQMNSAYDMLAQTSPNIAMMSGAPASAFQNAAANMAPPEMAPAVAETAAAAPATTSAAQGGIMGYYGGGIPGPGIDTGIVTEDDPDFAFTSPYQTAAGRLEKLYKKTHINQKPPAVAPSLGSIDLKPANMHKAAGGGIMGAAPSLGGYAAGGNPRLLKGPGDGMSDNIPAVIGGRQPARLADGEFVIPADVVSHLGNGSTDAGAKHLHTMMDNVRKARTGRKAQGKQINANKFIPR